MLTLLLQYEIPKLADDAYATVGRVLGQISTPEVGMRVLRDITDKESTAGALQRTLIDRMLALLPKDAPTSNGTNKRKRESISDRMLQSMPSEDHYSQVITVPKRSERAKTPTAKAKEYVSHHFPPVWRCVTD